jgi:hypothetical protein
MFRRVDKANEITRIFISYKWSIIFEVERILVYNSMVILIYNYTDWLLFFYILSDRISSFVIFIGVTVEKNLLSVGYIESKILVCPLIQLK